MELLHEVNLDYASGERPLDAVIAGDVWAHKSIEPLSLPDAVALQRTLRDPTAPDRLLLDGIDESHLPRYVPFAVFRVLGSLIVLNTRSHEVLVDALNGKSPEQAAGERSRSYHVLYKDRQAAQRALFARRIEDAVTQAIVSRQIEITPVYERVTMPVRAVCALTLSALGMGPREIRARCGQKSATAQAIGRAFASGLFVGNGPFWPDGISMTITMAKSKLGRIEDRLGPERRAAMITDYEVGVLRQDQIAEKYGISRGSVIRLLKQWGYYKPESVERKLGPEGKAAILEARESGMSHRKIAERHGIGPDTVRRLLERWHKESDG